MTKREHDNLAPVLALITLLPLCTFPMDFFFPTYMGHLILLKPTAYFHFLVPLTNFSVSTASSHTVAQLTFTRDWDSQWVFFRMIFCFVYAVISKQQALLERQDFFFNTTKPCVCSSKILG